ncbi:hypothetical protein HHI36_020552 [Cryptolaemus montrouzieri]|uniref:Uncharacterized protein n=1 Tax=Cryptolaemus montrouzieri TaxID=559131 RepID=A0ABD2NAP4_9CUCU
MSNTSTRVFSELEFEQFYQSNRINTENSNDVETFSGTERKICNSKEYLEINNEKLTDVCEIDLSEIKSEHSEICIKIEDEIFINQVIDESGVIWNEEVSIKNEEPNIDGNGVILEIEAESSEEKTEITLYEFIDEEKRIYDEKLTDACEVDRSKIKSEHDEKCIKIEDEIYINQFIDEPGIIWNEEVSIKCENSEELNINNGENEVILESETQSSEEKNETIVYEFIEKQKSSEDSAKRRNLNEVSTTQRETFDDQVKRINIVLKNHEQSLSDDLKPLEEYTGSSMKPSNTSFKSIQSPHALKPIKKAQETKEGFMSSNLKLLKGETDSLPRCTFRSTRIPKWYRPNTPNKLMDDNKSDSNSLPSIPAVVVQARQGDLRKNPRYFPLPKERRGIFDSSDDGFSSKDNFFFFPEVKLQMVKEKRSLLKPLNELLKRPAKEEINKEMPKKSSVKPSTTPSNTSFKPIQSPPTPKPIKKAPDPKEGFMSSYLKFLKGETDSLPRWTFRPTRKPKQHHPNTPNKVMDDNKSDSNSVPSIPAVVQARQGDLRKNPRYFPLPKKRRGIFDNCDDGFSSKDNCFFFPKVELQMVKEKQSLLKQQEELLKRQAKEEINKEMPKKLKTSKSLREVRRPARDRKENESVSKDDNSDPVCIP